MDRSKVKSGMDIEYVAAPLEKSDRIDISICIISFNQEKYIEKCISSILSQKFQGSFEIIVSDDRSTDDTRSIIDRYCAEFPVLTKNYQEENQGFQRNIRSAISRCRAEFIAFCEADDYWMDEYKLQKQLDFMKSNPRCTICFGGYVSVREDGSLIGRKKIFDSPADMDVKSVIEGGGALMPTFTIMAKADAVKAIIDKIITCPVLDFPLQVLVAAQGYAHYDPSIFGAYRRFSIGSWTLSMQDREKYLTFYRGRRLMFELLDRELEHKYLKSFRKLYRKETLAFYIVRRLPFRARVSELINDWYWLPLIDRFAALGFALFPREGACSLVCLDYSASQSQILREQGLQAYLSEMEGSFTFLRSLFTGVPYWFFSWGYE